MKTFPDDFSLSHGVWHPHQHDYIAYSDGEPTESYLSNLFSYLQPLASDSPECQQYIKDWPSQYHLSPLRANLLRILPLATECSVLELGSGCGAITRYLGETCRRVFAVEGSSLRAQLTRKRCRDLANVEVIAANFDDLVFRESFDVITLIGVLEYAQVYGRNPLDPFVGLLRLACQHLQEQGVLILAIENQLGIKYLAGANEDHLGRPYLGVQGYLDDHTPQTFGRIELLHLIDEAGFSECQLLLPFPDYKLPVTFINGKFTSASEVHDYNLMDWCRQPSQDYTSSRPFLFNEHLALTTAAHNGLLADHANSFLAWHIKGLWPQQSFPSLTGFAGKSTYPATLAGKP